MDHEGVQAFTLLCVTILLFEERDKANNINIFPTQQLIKLRI